MTVGIYCYIDKKDNKIIYIGKDSHIENDARHRYHTSKCAYHRQKINAILQNNPNRYKYKILRKGDFSQDFLNDLEKKYISIYNPKFNFTEGGDGTIGYSHSDKDKKRISKTKSERCNSCGFYRVYKAKRKDITQGFLWVYRYMEDNKRKWISSVNIKELEQKVKNKGLEWKCFNE